MAKELSLKHRLLTALQSIGNTKDTAPPKGNNNKDPLLHEYFIATEAASYFDKRKKAILKTIEDQFIDDKNIEPSSNYVLAKTPHYVLTLETNAGQHRINRAKIGTALFKRGWKEKDVEDFLEEITTKTRPSRTVRSVPVANGNGG